ncbi:hypothetical protein SNE25_06830 [Mucilaginibacter sabulilitoris]|uniref:Uncharacterized protein n=1 Tax=Mucilaginibacter sabulilitoris TaxID=1173583 RepID=A0ABZ0TQ10_9SPHI|nr:hypothetical protein [Mucilaginibacter sabulilitoris]WPU95235.1 hypothetical protein SNE25_06830 [Mucilaginibacter sabulilitoris]
MKKIFLIISLLFPGIISNAQELRTNISVHDPVMTRQDSTYYIFVRVMGLQCVRRLIGYWKAEKPVFATAPQWAVDGIPGFKGHIWVPKAGWSRTLKKISYYTFTKSAISEHCTNCQLLQLVISNKLLLVLLY